MKSRVLKWEIPIDDEWHKIPALIGGWHIGQQVDESVKIWSQTSGRLDQARVTSVRVFGTGQDFDGFFLGSVQSPSGLVWHLVQANS